MLYTINKQLLRSTIMPYRVELIGVFHTFELYDEKGREVLDLETAAMTAEAEYGDQWSCVYNGADAISRDDWI